jgi:hypothetical protein
VGLKAPDQGGHGGLDLGHQTPAPVDGRLKLVRDDPHVVLHEGEKDLFLALKVKINGTLRGAGCFHNIVDDRSVEPFLGEDAGGRVENLAARVLLLRLIQPIERRGHSPLQICLEFPLPD